MVSTQTQTSETEFIKREIAIWGEDYIEDLLDKGFLPVLLEERGSLKWSWALSTNRP